MQCKFLIILAICVFSTQAVEAVGNEKLTPQQMLKFLKTCQQFEEAGSDTYAVGGNINCENYSEHTGR